METMRPGSISKFIRNIYSHSCLRWPNRDRCGIITPGHYQVYGKVKRVAEDEILKKVRSSGAAASHPLLLPSIFAELERSRHVQILDRYKDDMERSILDLDYGVSISQLMTAHDNESRHRNGRAQWLDTRNSLVTWKQQLSKMAKQADELSDTIFSPGKGQATQVGLP
ncbi:hypothetical protein GGR54DRAFT_82841 [Hypoxylon sp. NC1633]|nr:hypothetical protein GGR54DRAFT_82841 [Hypoxylon sp. NC1633]